MKRGIPPLQRRKVLWLGEPPDAAVRREFEHRQLVFQECDQEAATKEFPAAVGIVFRFDAKKTPVFKSHLEAIAPAAADHGLLLVVLADDDHSYQKMETALRRSPLRPAFVKRTAPAEHEIAERIARHDPGPAAGKVEIKGEDVPELTKLFLRRAFFDCRSITIASLTGGRSANVFSVYAVFEDSLVGPRPLPFFAKVDVLQKIDNEWGNYENVVGHFIPFNARPNLDPQRCLFGATHGMLVGNFVEQSESLWTVARRGMAQAAIYSLFDHALRGWRLQAYAHDDARAFRTSMMESLSVVFDPARIPAKRVALARKLTEATLPDPDKLYATLKGHDSLKHRVAPMHGDLHAKNVCVRGGDAILIDFNSTRTSGPLVADPASLEVSLACEVGPAEKDNVGWREVVDKLYDPSYLLRPPPPPNEPAPREWLWSCIRQIRLIGLASQTTDKEYQFALALYLLRRASFRDESPPDRYRRAYAYVLASRLVADIISGKAKGGANA